MLCHSVGSCMAILTLSPTQSDTQRITARSHDAVIRVYDAADNVIETHEHKGDFKEWVSVVAENKKPPCGEARRLIVSVG